MSLSYETLLAAIGSMQFFVCILLVGIVYVLYKRRKVGKTAVVYKRLRVNAGAEGKVNTVVTGGNGCLGKSIVKNLLADGGYNVNSLDLVIPGDKDRNVEVCSYIQADITNLDDLISALRESSKVDVVFHVASIVPHKIGFAAEDFHRVNTNGTKNVLEACHECGVKRLIYTSSCSVVLSKDHFEVIDNTDESYPLPSNPVNPYIASKQAAERLVRAANGKNGLLTCAMRPSGLFGGTNNATVQALMHSWISCYIGDGKYAIAFVPIDAAARAHILAEKKLSMEGIDSVVAGKAYNLAMNERVTLVELLKYLRTEVNGPPCMSIPMWILPVAAFLNTHIHALTGIAVLGDSVTTMIVDGFREHTFSSALAHRELGWEELPPWQEFVKQYVNEHWREMEEKKQK